MSEEAHEVYRRAVTVLTDAELPFLVGGASPWPTTRPSPATPRTSTSSSRPQDVPHRAGHPARRPGSRPRCRSPTGWARPTTATCSSTSSSARATGWRWSTTRGSRTPSRAEVLGVPLPLCPAEEMIWSKAFVLERERFDGADVAHLIRDCGPQLDWERCCAASAAHWRVLYAHLILFGFASPGHRGAMPRVGDADPAPSGCGPRRRRRGQGRPGPVPGDAAFARAIPHRRRAARLPRCAPARRRRATCPRATWKSGPSAIPGRKHGGPEPGGNR